VRGTPGFSGAECLAQNCPSHGHTSGNASLQGRPSGIGPLVALPSQLQSPHASQEGLRRQAQILRCHAAVMVTTALLLRVRMIRATYACLIEVRRQHSQLQLFPAVNELGGAAHVAVGAVADSDVVARPPAQRL
jgi:hypothetical protein